MPKKVRLRESEIPELLEKLPPVEKKTNEASYLPLLLFSIGDMNVSDLRHHLQTYRDNYGRSKWSCETLDEYSGKCSEIDSNKIEKLCSALDRPSSVARYLFSKFAFTKQAFRATGIVVLGYPSRLRTQLEDSVLMTAFVEKFTEELQRWREGDGGKVFKATVIYTYQRALAVFSIDRYDTADFSALPESCLIYIVEGIPSLFIVPYLTPLNVICGSLETVLSKRMIPEYPPEQNAPLYEIIVREATRLQLRRDSFPDDLKALLHFQANTLNQLVRECGLEKYPVNHCCPFKTTRLEVAGGLVLEMKTSKGENLVEVLYTAEKAKKIILPKEVIRDLADGKRNSFKPFDLTTSRK